MNLKFVEGGPAILVRGRQRILVVADLHIGIEAELSARGWHVASRTKDRLERVIACINGTDPDLLLLLGDVKHNLPLTTRQEFRELPEFLRELRRRLPLRILPGNHDTYLSRFTEPGELLGKRGVVLDGTGYFHGHMVPSPALNGRLIIAGHHHPLVAIHDEVGCALRSPAYLLARVDPAHLFGTRGTEDGSGSPEGPVPRGRQTRVLLMPAFNECAGFDVVRIVRHPFSPISRALIAHSAEVLLPDGTCLGPVGSRGGESPGGGE